MLTRYLRDMRDGDYVSQLSQFIVYAHVSDHTSPLKINLLEDYTFIDYYAHWQDKINQIHYISYKYRLHDFFVP